MHMAIAPALTFVDNELQSLRTGQCQAQRYMKPLPADRP
jgi:hypothetical protein